MAKSEEQKKAEAEAKAARGRRRAVRGQQVSHRQGTARKHIGSRRRRKKGGPGAGA